MSDWFSTRRPGFTTDPVAESRTRSTQTSTLQYLPLRRIQRRTAQTDRGMRVVGRPPNRRDFSLLKRGISHSTSQAPNLCFTILTLEKQNWYPKPRPHSERAGHADGSLLPRSLIRNRQKSRKRTSGTAWDATGPYVSLLILRIVELALLKATNASNSGNLPPSAMSLDDRSVLEELTQFEPLLGESISTLKQYAEA